MKLFYLLCFMMLTASAFPQGEFLREGHRGCRGLMPENTIAAMEKAIDLGINVLEMDLIISSDQQVVVSHDLFMAAAFCLKPSGDSITTTEEHHLLLYKIPYAAIRRYDAGTKHNDQFPRQKNFKACKPLLAELVDSVDAYARRRHLPLPSFNLEIKSSPEGDDIEHPKPQPFIDLVMKVCKDKNILRRINIQSFDVRPLRILHQQHPTLPLSFLVMNNKTAAENCDDLGFIPDIYSPYYKMADPTSISFCHEHRMQIIPWTVNTREEIQRLQQQGVDGIITDYPDLF